jgi:hypothetical protein
MPAIAVTLAVVEGVKQGVISGITAAAINEIAHGGANGTSEFSDLEQLALQGLVGGISTELRGGKFQDGFVSAIVSKGVDLGLEGQQLDFYTISSMTAIAVTLAVVGSSVVALMVIRAIATAICQ